MALVKIPASLVRARRCLHLSSLRFHISAVERGVSKASINMLLSYCARLMMTPNEVLGYDKDNILPELKTLLAGMSEEQRQKIFQILKRISEI